MRTRLTARQDDAVASFASHLRVERHASPHTQRAYLADVRQFLAFAGAPADGLLGLRDRAILELLYSSGLRVSELAGLDWDAIDTDAGLVRVLGKGRRERVVPVGRPALHALAAYR